MKELEHQGLFMMIHAEARRHTKENVIFVCLPEVKIGISNSAICKRPAGTRSYNCTWKGSIL